MKRTTPLLRHTRLRSVSSKRAKQLRNYSALRKAFLEKHRWCHVWLAVRGISEDEVRAVSMTLGNRGVVLFRGNAVLVGHIPAATEIHHTNKRHGERLNDEQHWLAVCRESHRWIHDNPAAARQLGFLVCDTRAVGGASLLPAKT